MPIVPGHEIAGRITAVSDEIEGFAVGGLTETQEMLDFCAEHGVTADIEMISMEQIDDAYDRMVAGDVKFRSVIDMESMPVAAV